MNLRILKKLSKKAAPLLEEYRKVRLHRCESPSIFLFTDWTQEIPTLERKLKNPRQILQAAKELIAKQEGSSDE